jgi:(S)-ureidoglycine aminohydrolase
LQEVTSGHYGWSEFPTQKTSTGLERRIFEGKTRDLAHFTMQAITLNPGKSRSGLVSQKAEAVLIVKSGELQVTVGAETKTLGTGSVALILPDAEHAVKNASSSDATFYLLDYQPRSPMDAARGEAAGGSLLVDWKALPFKPHDKGGRRDFFDRPTAACSRYEMHTTTLNPNTESHPPHIHRTSEMFVILEGNVVLQIDDDTFQGGNGDVFFVESDVPHAIKNVGEGQAVYFAFQGR